MIDKYYWTFSYIYEHT